MVIYLTAVNLLCENKLIQLRGRYVEQTLMRSSSFECDQIHNEQSYALSHTLLSLSSPTYKFLLKQQGVPPTEAMLLRQIIFPPFLREDVLG